MHRNSTVLAALLVVVSLAMAGCLPPPAPPPETTTPASPPAETPCTPFPDAPVDASAPQVDGDNAFSHMLRLVCDYDDDPPTPRYRIPGTDGQTAAAVWLHDTLAAHGWNATYQNFTGQDYQAIEDKDGAANFVNGCSQEDQDRVSGLPFSNVLASHGSGEGVVILMAHYDSKWHANADPDPARQKNPVLGANDGASGVGVLLEVARAWDEADYPFETRIFFTDGEDGFDDCHALAGALYYVDNLSEIERGRIQAVFLLDMVGNRTSPFMLAGTSALADRVRDAAADAGVEAVAGAPEGGVYDDHSPFLDRGVPAVDLIPSDFSNTDYWHTTHDVPSKLHPDFMGDIGRVVIHFLDKTAQA